MTNIPKLKNANPSKSRVDLTTGAITPHLLKMGLPMTWGIFAIISFQIADLYFIGKISGDALAAISFTIPVTMTVFSISLGLMIAIASVVSRLIGEKLEDKVVRVSTHAVFFSVILGLIISIIGVLTLEPVFKLLGADELMMGYIRDYMYIWYFANIFALIPMNGNAVIRAGGNTMFPAIVMTIVSIINIALNPIFIFGYFGFPAMGIQGAAYSTFAANVIAALAVLYMLYFKMEILRLKPFYWNKLGDSFKRLIFIALPAGLTSTIQPITSAVIVALLAKYGADAVAAYGIVSRVEALAFVVLMGLAGGMSPILGQNYGAKNHSRVFETLKKALSFSAIWALIVAVFLGLFAKQIAGLFTTEEQIIQIAALYFWIIPLSYITSNLVSGWSSAFNALGKPQFSAAMIFVKYIICHIPALYIGAHYGGVIGIFISIAAVNLIIGLILHLIGWHKCKKICGLN